jgi:methyltransferase-like protein
MKVDTTPEIKNALKRLEFIKNNTSTKLNTPYFIIVHSIARNMARPLSFPIEVKTGKRHTREFELGELIQELEEAHIKINEIEQQIAQNYSIDIPLNQQGQAIVFDFNNPKQGMEDRFKF